MSKRQKITSLIISLLCIVTISTVVYSVHVLTVRTNEYKKSYEIFKSSKVYTSKDEVLTNGYVVIEGVIESDSKITGSKYCRSDSNVIWESESIEEYKKNKWKQSSMDLGLFDESYSNYTNQNIKVLGNTYDIQEFDLSLNDRIDKSIILDNYKNRYSNNFIWLSGNSEKPETGDKRVKLCSIKNKDKVVIFAKIKNGELDTDPILHPILCTGNDAYSRIEDYLKKLCNE